MAYAATQSPNAGGTSVDPSFPRGVQVGTDLRVVRNARVTQLLQSQGTPTSINTAGATTLTIAQLLTGIITIDCNGAGRTVTLPTAALLVAGINGCEVGDTIGFRISNGSDAAETITLAEGTGGGWDANFLAAKTIVQNAWADIIIRVTNVTSGAEAYVVYK